MSQYSTRFQSWLNGLTQRERVTVFVGALTVLAILIYLFIWQPQVQGHSELSRQVETKSKLLLWMERASTEVEALRRSGGSLTVNNNINTQQQISRLASTTGIRISRSEKANPDHIKLRFDSVEFNRLLVFLDSAVKSGIVLSSVNIKVTDKSGFVSARAMFENK